MNLAIRSIALMLCLLAGVAAAHLATELLRPAELQNFITRKGDQLIDGEKPFRFISFNIPNLLVIEDAFEFTKPSPWRWPDEFEIDDALESVRQMGGQVVRTYVISVFREGSDMGKTVHVLAPGKFNEEGFRALDKVLEVANRKGIRADHSAGGQLEVDGRRSRSTPPSAANRPTTSGPIRAHRRLQKDDRLRAQSQEHVHRHPLQRRPRHLRLGDRQRDRRHARVDPRDRRLHQEPRSRTTWWSTAARSTASNSGSSTSRTTDVITTHHYPSRRDPISCRQFASRPRHDEGQKAVLRRRIRLRPTRRTSGA